MELLSYTTFDFIIIMNDVTTHYISLLAGTSKVMARFVTTMQIFVEINKL